MTSPMEATAAVEQLPKSSFWRRLRHRTTPIQWAALVCLGVILILGVLAPWLPLPSYQSTAFVAHAYSFPSWSHPFGIDPEGRDYLSRNIYAIRVTLSIGFMTALIGAVIGVPLGVTAAYLGGVIDWVVLRLVEVLSVIPPLLVAILLANLVSANVLTLSLVIGAVLWVPVTRLVRSKVLSVREMPYVDAARALGASRWRIAWHYLLRNSFGTLVVALVLTVPTAITTEAGLSFLGLGIEPPTPDWGEMISEGLQYVTYYWYLALFPALMLLLTVVSLSLAGDWLRDWLDPQH
jgi:ABC-type dipeptide/oligopeptide/nickel transport system permease subunit